MFHPQLYCPNVFLLTVIVTHLSVISLEVSLIVKPSLVEPVGRTSAILSNLPIFYLILLNIKILLVFWFLELFELRGERTVLCRLVSSTLSKKVGKQRERPHV